MLVPHLTDTNTAPTEDFSTATPFSQCTSPMLHSLTPKLGRQQVGLTPGNRPWTRVYSQPLCSCSNSTLNQGQCLCERQVWMPKPRPSCLSLLCPGWMYFQCAGNALGSPAGRFVEPVCILSWHGSSLTKLKRKAVSFCPFIISALYLPWSRMPC